MNEKQNYIKLVCSFLTGFMFCYILFSSRESAEMEQIRKQYQDSVDQCRQLSEQLDQSRKRVEEIQSAISTSRTEIQEAGREIASVKDGMRSDAEILRECQQLIKELRKEHESRNP